MENAGGVQGLAGSVSSAPENSLMPFGSVPLLLPPFTLDRVVSSKYGIVMQMNLVVVNGNYIT